MLVLMNISHLKAVDEIQVHKSNAAISVYKCNRLLQKYLRWDSKLKHDLVGQVSDAPQKTLLAFLIHFGLLI
jgi:hypothetical protein